MTNLLFVHDLHSTISNDEAFLQDCLENLEEMLRRYYMNSGMHVQIFHHIMVCYPLRMGSEIII